MGLVQCTGRWGKGERGVGMRAYTRLFKPTRTPAILVCIAGMIWITIMTWWGEVLNIHCKESSFSLTLSFSLSLSLPPSLPLSQILSFSLSLSLSFPLSHCCVWLCPQVLKFDIFDKIAFLLLPGSDSLITHLVSKFQ